jgi:hypothetical protein
MPDRRDGQRAYLWKNVYFQPPHSVPRRRRVPGRQLVRVPVAGRLFKGVGAGLAAGALTFLLICMGSMPWSSNFRAAIAYF